MSADSENKHTTDLTKLHLWQIQWVRDILFLVIIFCGLWVGYVMRDITVPLLVALLLAYLFEPVISYLANNPKLPIGRIPVIAGILTLIITAVLAVVAITIPIVVSQTSSLVNDVQSGKLRAQLERVTTNYAPTGVKTEILETLDFLPGEDTENVVASTEIGKNEITESGPKGASEGIVRIAKTTGDVAFSVLKSMLHFVILAVLIPFYFFFFSLWFPKVKQFAGTLIPKDGKSSTLQLFEKMDAAVAGFVRGRIVIAFIMAIILAIGWMIVGVPYAIILGIGIGFLCAVPFLGLIGIPLSVGLLFLNQLGIAEADQLSWWAIILWPSLVFAIVQALDGWILTPLIAGRATNLDPVTIFVAVLAGGSVLGAYGMLLAVPFAACIKILIQERLLPKVHLWANGEADDPLPFDD
ncbi:MAG: AI-2E family transporter [Phycisphaerae bacterium]|jgi:predicted PurR-regulated permease PerM|nr:AI-2E family transporter [Phycisphaerae bacterium]MBT6164753.1 AI-2E family transporter [Phycisphaerae bacterium]MBT7657885.1 AI-2E family transporter [Phycisphaerae bacterium]